MSENRKRHINGQHVLILLAVICMMLIVIVLGLSAVTDNGLHQAAASTAASAAATASAAPVSSAAAATATPDPACSDTGSYVLIANKKHPLSADYVPSDLVDITGIPKQNREEQMRSEAADNLIAMFNQASQEGVQLYFISGYRSYAYQENVYNGYVQSDGAEYADSISSRPGYSDHQTGLACDLGQVDLQGTLDETFINTAAGQWLYAHAHEYGFILRYPQGKEEITGYTYEPWHYRYVGKDVANAMYAISPDETMEEYFHVSGGDYAS